MLSVLPQRANLSHLKAQAKDLLANYQTGQAEAVARVRAYFAETASIQLSEAQLVVSREYGFASWTKLKSHVELRSGASQQDDADRLAALAMESDANAVLARLSEAPDLATTTLSAACVTGNRNAVIWFIESDPRLIRAKVGEKQWEPLLYVCYSCLLKDADYRPRLVETARWLLENGADANAHWLNPQWDNMPEPCLYGATGVNDCPELAQLLLNAGANPNDNESLYHSTELATPDCLRLLLDNGASVSHGNGLMHLLDREEPEWVRLFLGYAKSPAEIPPVIPHALRRGRSAEVFRALLASGMAMDVRDHNGLTPYQSAARLGRVDVCELLAEAGADTTLSPVDTLLARITGGEKILPEDVSPEAIALLNAEPAPELIRQAEAGKTVVLETLLAAGANPNVRDSQCVPIHQACLHGHIDAVRVLLKYGADPRIEDTVHEGHAVGWACAGSQNHFASQETYVTIVELLLDNGGVLPETAWGSREVREVLVRRGAKPA